MTQDATAQQNDTQSALSALPGVIPIFPLAGVLLLPRGQLPLNIFEPRYLSMVDDALKSSRIIGMIQPRTLSANAPLYQTGCAGKITAFNETDDGRYEITLTGLCRFSIGAEIEDGATPYRRVHADWDAFAADLVPVDCLNMDRAHLKSLLMRYFQMTELSCNWEQIDNTPDEKLITCLSMICPLEAGEKQALLEAPCCRERAALFTSLLELAVRSGKTASLSACH